MGKGITRNRRIIGFVIIFVGLIYILNGIDHLVNEDQFATVLFFEFLSLVGGLELIDAYFSLQLIFIDSNNEFFNDVFFNLFNLDYIPLFIIGIVLILLSRKIIFKIPFRGKKNG